MYKGYSILGIIPARGGSKGIKRKNIKVFAGKPLIAWTINEAISSGIFDELIVSTDDEEIKQIAEKFGADVPFMRPKELSTDRASSRDVILHAMEHCEKKDRKYELVVCLQPTSPLRTKEDILAAIDTMKRRKASAVISVCHAYKNPLWMNTLPANGRMDSFIRKYITKKNRQKLPLYYQVNGAVYVWKWDYYKKNKSTYSAKTFAYVMPKKRSIDIDDEFDWIIGEELLKRKSD